MKERLAHLRAEIESFARQEHDIIDQAALLWRIIYGVAVQYRCDHPDWSFKRHEDLSRNPATEFEELFGRVGLEWTDRARWTVDRYSTADGAHGARRGDPMRRDSRANIMRWKDRLQPEEIRRVKDRTEEVWKEFYGPEDW